MSREEKRKDVHTLMKDINDITAELIIFGEGPEDIKNAIVIDEFKTPTSESFLLDVGEFEDGARMYITAERFESTGWKWSNSFPEMDAWQLADYLEGSAELPNINNWEDHNTYTKGLLKFAGCLRTIAVLNVAKHNNK